MATGCCLQRKCLQRNKSPIAGVASAVTLSAIRGASPPDRPRFEFTVARDTLNSPASRCQQFTAARMRRVSACCFGVIWVVTLSSVQSTSGPGDGLPSRVRIRSRSTSISLDRSISARVVSGSGGRGAVWWFRRAVTLRWGVFLGVRPVEVLEAAAGDGAVPPGHTAGIAWCHVDESVTRLTGPHLMMRSCRAALCRP